MPLLLPGPRPAPERAARAGVRLSPFDARDLTAERYSTTHTLDLPIAG